MKAAAPVAVWGGLAVLVLLAATAPGRTGARRPARTLGAVAVAAVVVAVATLGLRYVVESVWKPFPDQLHDDVYLAIGAGLLAVVLGVGALVGAVRRRGGPVRAVATVVVALVVVTGAAQTVNLQFAAYPTLGSVVGIPDYRTVEIDELAAGGPPVALPRPLAAHWSPPADAPTDGAVARAAIPGEVSGFSARDAVVYVPPAYFAEPRPALPVLVLVSGQPGGPDDWIRGGQLAQVINRFAAEHAGLAPVVVVPDPLGSPLGNTLCVDSGEGDARTYLAVDVPRWIGRTLHVDTSARARAIGGLSFGGTCALQMALSDPEVYPTFLAISPQEEPTLGDRERTVTRIFGGDEAAFTAVNPLDRMARQRYPQLAGAFVVGRDDREYGPGVETLYRAAQAAGVDARFEPLPGGHDFLVWSGGLESQLPWLASRLGVTG